MIKITKSVNQLKLEEFIRFSSLLEGIDKFVNKHRDLTYIEFDYYVVHDMTLFTIDPEFDFKKLEILIQQVKKSTSAIKRIFTKPIIVLKDSDDVLPVENARIINQNTLLHLANHSQYVSNITKKGIMPRKLLTRIYEDDYSIYENIIFCNYIDEVLSWMKSNRKVLNSLLYASNILQFNLLEKVNHLKYYLALGKLHTGYIRDFSQFFNLSKNMLEEFSLISQAIIPRLHKPIYKRNVSRNRNLRLKKTNIFLMQKDYRQVYKTYKNLLGNQIKVQETEVTIDYDLMRRNYMMYVQILTVFSVGHFHFEMDPQIKMNLSSLDVSFTFKDWKLDIISNDKKEILLHFIKDEIYKIMITSDLYDMITINNLKKDYGIHELIVVNQFDEDYLERDDIYVSIQDVDSFRRIQQIILKGMIYSDTKRDTCPYCGGKLHKDHYQGFHQCDDCMTQIKEAVCKESKKSFFYTDIAHFRKHLIKKSDFKHHEYWHYTKQIETSMFFRNITKINHHGDTICPHCLKIHENI